MHGAIHRLSVSKYQAKTIPCYALSGSEQSRKLSICLKYIYNFKYVHGLPKSITSRLQNEAGIPRTTLGHACVFV